MFRRGFWRMGIAGLIGDINADSVYVLARDKNNYVILGVCATASIPGTSATDSYAIGCLLINSTTGTLHYNSGTLGGTVADPVFAAVGYNFMPYMVAGGFGTGACGATA
jgi:hypothetical protein